MLLSFVLYAGLRTVEQLGRSRKLCFLVRMEKFWYSTGETENGEDAVKLKTGEIPRRVQDLLAARARPRKL